MFSELFIFLLILQVTYSKLIVEEQHHHDISGALKIISQFPEISTIVIYYDKNYENSELIAKLVMNLKLNIFMVQYNRTQKSSIEENYSHFYILFFQDTLNLKHFIEHLHYKIQVLLILAIHATSEVTDKARNVCSLINVYVIETSTSKVLTCNRGRDKDESLAFVNINENHHHNVRDIFNFLGRVFKVATTFFPTRLEYLESGSDIKLIGSEATLLNVLSQHLNFSYTIIKLTGVSRFSKAINMVSRGEVDFAVGAIAQDYNRSRLTSYSLNLLVESELLFYGGLIENHNFINIRGTLLLFSCLVIVYAVKKIHTNIFEYHTNSDDFLMVLQPLLNQPAARKKTWKKSIKLLFLVWWCFCFFISTCYLTNLFQTFFNDNAIYKNLSELAAHGYKFQCAEWEIDYINKSCTVFHTPVCDVVVSKQSSTCQAIERLPKEKIAILEGEYIFQHNFLKCKGETSQPIHTIKDPIFGLGLQAWPMRNQSLLRRPFNNIINNLIATGVMQYWWERTNYFMYYRKNKHISTTSHFLEMGCIRQIFYILLVGYTVSGIVFVIEIIWNKIETRK